MKTLSEIQSVLTSHKQQLFGKYPIKSMAIFGSYSRNEQTDDSDLDILVEFKDKIGIRFIDLAEEIENIIGCNVNMVSKKGVKEKYLQVIHPELVYV